MNSDKRFLGGKEASKILGVHQRTLYNWEKKNLIEVIRTPGNKRLYNVDKYLNRNVANEQEKLKLAYVRVSSSSQREDLERQKQEIINLFPNHILIEDIGSGLNLNKRGIKKIVNYAINGEIDELVVLHKDRLCRFGFDHIKSLIEDYSGGKIVIVHQNDNITPEEELVKDVMNILNVYTAKMNGLRRYSKIKEKEEDYQEI
jgi:putative resolvase